MSDTQTVGNPVVQSLITSYFPMENKLSSVETLSSDLKTLLQKPVVSITHVSETLQSKQGNKRWYLGLDSSTVEKPAKRVFKSGSTCWGLCDSNTSAGTQSSPSIHSPLGSDSELVCLRKY
jgi:hypothetical protein